nr:hypothetical protein [Tanacetum cinerariifolium]
FPLPVEGVPTARRIEIPLPGVCTAMMKQSKIDGSYTKKMAYVLPMILAVTDFDVARVAKFSHESNCSPEFLHVDGRDTCSDQEGWIKRSERENIQSNLKVGSLGLNAMLNL